MRCAFETLVTLLTCFGIASEPVTADDTDKNDVIVINIGGGGAGGEGTQAKYIRAGDSSQKPVEVRVGQTVRWVNKDDHGHTATSSNKGRDDKPLFDTGELDKKDAKKDIKFDASIFRQAGGQAGGKVELQYFCAFHPRMKSTIVLIDKQGK
jgi:plastocyanin